MFKDARHAVILRQLRLRGTVTTDQLADELGVSVISIRRDLRDLEQQGQLRRVHGGATVPRRIVREESPLETAAIGLNPASSRPDAPLAVIGLIVPGSEYYFGDIIKGAAHAAKIAGIRLILGVTHYSTEKELGMVRHLAELGAEAIIFTPSNHDLTVPAVHALLTDPPAPIVLMERRNARTADAPALDSVRTDHALGAELAVRHLHSMGKRRIALMAFPNATAPHLQEGYAAAIADLGLEPVEVDLQLSEKQVGEWAADPDRFAGAYLDLAEEQGVDGLLVNPDMHAVSLARLLVSRGREVPGDVALVAYDDVIAELCEVPMSAVAPAKFDLGANAVGLALQRIKALAEGRALATVHSTLVPKLNVRDVHEGALITLA
ncbi:DeoR/GlpR family transcriptional regulator [Microbacterium sp. NEAU-LLC]|uniref:DeoR/GlpR family transcriptional regulator n=1 Tax=Microbacterium helvum TaxID=2773713 RepID=A0ABR8NNR1_9MICO|nr:substrate-binding domain-containing protein [Microbacterium helvum]MBD3942077.1 DeoR/GlpR family transcriptional regulator [Microbacterium helvum]